MSYIYIYIYLTHYFLHPNHPSKITVKLVKCRDVRHDGHGDHDDEVVANVQLDPKHIREHLDCLTYLHKQLVKCNDGDLENRIETCHLSIEEIKLEIEKCKNSMRIIDCDVDVNLLLCNLDTLGYYLKQIHNCYVNEMHGSKRNFFVF